MHRPLSALPRLCGSPVRKRFRPEAAIDLHIMTENDVQCDDQKNSQRADKPSGSTSLSIAELRAPKYGQPARLVLALRSGTPERRLLLSCRHVYNRRHEFE